MNQTLAIVRPIALTNLTEALTGRSTGDHVHPVCPDELLQVGWGKLRQVFAENERHVLAQIGAINLDGFGVKVDRCKSS